MCLRHALLWHLGFPSRSAMRRCSKLYFAVSVRLTGRLRGGKQAALSQAW